MAGFINRASFKSPTDKTLARRSVPHGAIAFHTRDHTPVVIPEGFKITKLVAGKASGLNRSRSSGQLCYGIGDRQISQVYCAAKIRGQNASKR